MQRRSILEIPYPVARFPTCRPTFKLFACSCSSGVDQSTCSGCGGIVVCKHSRTRWKTTRLHLSAATPRASSTSVIISFLFFINFLFSSLLRFGAPQSSPAKITRASQSSQPKIAAVLRRCLNQLDRKEVALSSLAFAPHLFSPDVVLVDLGFISYLLGTHSRNSFLKVNTGVRS